MQNSLFKFILVGALVFAVLGAIANILGAGTLDYNAKYNFYGADEERIDKNLDGNPNSTPYPRQLTVLGGVVFAIILGGLIGVITFYTKSETAYVLSAVSGLLLSGFVISPTLFYKYLPPVAHDYVIIIVIPAVILSVALSIFLERFKPKEAEVEEVELTPQQKQQLQKQQQLQQRQLRQQQQREQMEKLRQQQQQKRQQQNPNSK